MEVSFYDKEIETADREVLAAHQKLRLQKLLDELLASNPFYGHKLRESGFTDACLFRSIDDIQRLPFTVKSELVEDQERHPPFGTNLTYSLEKYTRLHQTSGTTGKPLRWLDTSESWDWWARSWAAVYRAAGIAIKDRIYFAFSFGPFIGFWAAWAGCSKIGALAISGGAQDSANRLRSLVDLEATALCCTPSYALHLAEISRKVNIDLRKSAVKKIVVAGEPGGSIPGTKSLIEQEWDAALYDHTGATEIGAHGMTCLEQSGVHLNEGEFLVEVLDPETHKPADEGELVITNLGRFGSPVIRYRTGDRIRLKRDVCGCGRTFVRMDGGIIGRLDQMLVVRGVNIFPSSLEAIVRLFPAVQEFAVTVDRIGNMDEIQISAEVSDQNPQNVLNSIRREMSQRLGLRVEMLLAADGSLPRFELKAKRITDRRKQ